MLITLEEAEFLTAIGDFSDVILLIEEASHNKLWSVWFLDQVWDFLLQVIRFLWAWLFRKCILSYYPSSSWWCILYCQYHIFIICNRVWTERLSYFTSPIILPLSNLFFFWKVTAYSCPSPQSPFISPTMEGKKRTFNVWLPLILRFHKFLCLITILLSLILSWRPLHSLLYSCKKTILSQVHIKNLLLLRTWCFKMITFSDSNYKLNLGFKWRSITLLVPWIYMCLSF